MINEEKQNEEDRKINEEDYEEEMRMLQFSKRKSCCKMFTLSTSISIFLYIDLLMLLFIISMMNFNLGHVLSLITGKVHKRDKFNWYN